MALILSGSDGLSDIDGSAATPAIRGTDANTGIFFPAADTIAFSEGGVEAARFDSAGNLGIATTSPSTYGKLAVRAGITVSAGSTSLTGTTFSTSDAANSTFWINHASAVTNLVTDAPMAFWTASGSGVAERARILSDGTFIIGKTTTSSSANGAYFTANGTLGMDFTISTTNEALTLNNISTAGTAQMDFRTAGTEKGNISWNNTNTTYNTTSDYRLKNTITPMTGALAKVALLKPCTYKWNIDGSNGEGFIAHELAEVVPQAVTGEKDEIRTYTDEDGNERTRPKYQGIDTSVLVATLTAAIQEQQAIIESLKARLDAANL